MLDEIIEEHRICEQCRKSGKTIYIIITTKLNKEYKSIHLTMS